MRARCPQRQPAKNTSPSRSVKEDSLSRGRYDQNTTPWLKYGFIYGHLREGRLEGVIIEALHEPLCRVNAEDRHSTHAMPCHAMPCHAMPCHAMPCHAMPCHAMPCHAMPCHAMPCHAMPCHAMPCAALRCAALRCVTLHCVALSYITLRDSTYIL